jgi:polysaccharide pyruvyl transferase WcaK-like protein
LSGQTTSSVSRHSLIERRLISQGPVSTVQPTALWHVQLCMEKTGQPKKIALFGHFGTFNHGQEATLLAIVSRLRVLLPNCELCCVCSNPENVDPTLELEAIPHTVRSVRIWDRRVPLGNRLRMALIGLSEEAREYLRIWRTLKDIDVFVIPGSNILHDGVVISGWGPYGLFKWSLMAKLRRCRVMFISVGAGPVLTALGGGLLRFSLALADYRSYRDVPSSRAVRRSRFRTKGDGIYPDLVLGLPSPTAATAAAPESRPVVGLGLMEYQARVSIANPLGRTYERYVESLAVFARWLVDHGYDVKLLLSDADTGVIDDFRQELSTRFGSTILEHVTYRPTDSVEDMLCELSATDFVVATRFHSVLMSMLVNKPVIAISFHHKCSALMRQMELSQYCHDISRMDGETLIMQFQDLVAHADEVRELIPRRVEASRRALEEQYELLFGGLISEQRAADAIPTAT